MRFSMKLQLSMGTLHEDLVAYGDRGFQTTGVPWLIDVIEIAIGIEIEIGS